MPTIPVPCAAVSGSDWATREDRHIETNRDVCITGGETRQVSARPGTRHARAVFVLKPRSTLGRPDWLCTP